MKRSIPIGLLLLLVLLSCQKITPAIDLLSLSMDEPLEKVVYAGKENILIGISTMEAPNSLAVWVSDSPNYSIDGYALDVVDVYFKIHSKVATETLKKRMEAGSGGASIDMKPAKTNETIRKLLAEFKADPNVYACMIQLKDKDLPEVGKRLIARYGKGTKNPNSDNGIYWDLKKENKFVLFAPDYSYLTIINKTTVSKTCYYDGFNGIIDFGGCDKEQYMKDFYK